MNTERWSIGFFTKLIVLLLVIPLVTLDISNAVSVDTEYFKDVPLNSYYSGAVNELYQLGIISGKGDGLFHPNDTITNAELMQILSKVSNIKISNTGNKWYTAAMNWASGEGIWKPGIDPIAPATRGELCGYICTYYQVDLNQTGQTIHPFEDSTLKCGEELYRQEVVYGVPGDIPGQRKLNEDSNITRAEAVVILHRAMLKLEKAPGNKDIGYYLYGIDKEYTPNHTIWDGTKPPLTREDFESLWLYLHYNNQREVTLDYRGYGIDYEVEYKNLERLITEGRYIIERLVPEYAYYETKYRLSRNRKQTPDGPYELTSIGIVRFSELDNTGFNEAITKQSEFNDACADELFGLFRNKALRVNMSDKEKLGVLFNYTSKNFEYDTSLVNKTGYDIFTSKTAICSGFVGIYSGMAHSLGIPVEGYTGTSKIDGVGHILIRVKDEQGNWVYIDPTFGDDKGTGEVRSTYFWMSQHQVDNYMIPDTWYK